MSHEYTIESEICKKSLCPNEQSLMILDSRLRGNDTVNSHHFKPPYGIIELIILPNGSK